MATNLDVVRLALTKRGAPYSAGSDRFGPVRYDCSGLIHATLRLLDVDDAAATYWTSRTYQDWITRAGLTSTLAHARVVPGMIVCKGHQDGPGGHIGLTGPGPGQIIETPSGEGRQVGISRFDRNHWDFAGAIPGVTYVTDGGGAPPPEEDDTMGFLAKLHFHDTVYFCRAGRRTPMPGPGFAEVVGQLVATGQLRDTRIITIGPETLKYFTHQPLQEGQIGG